MYACKYNTWVCLPCMCMKNFNAASVAKEIVCVCVCVCVYAHIHLIYADRARARYFNCKPCACGCLRLIAYIHLIYADRARARYFLLDLNCQSYVLFFCGFVDILIVPPSKQNHACMRVRMRICMYALYSHTYIIWCVCTCFLFSAASSSYYMWSWSHLEKTYMHGVCI
jgi:hypothetical protein